MVKKKSLEKTIQEKYWEISFPSLELLNPRMSLYIAKNATFSDAKKIFKKELLRRELRMSGGNVTVVAKDLGIDRKTVQRVIRELDIPFIDKGGIEIFVNDDDQVYKFPKEDISINYFYKRESGKLKTFIKEYDDLSWKEAELEFEKQFIWQALKRNNMNISKTAKDIGLRIETIYRKIKLLKIKI